MQDKGIGLKLILSEMMGGMRALTVTEGGLLWSGEGEKRVREGRERK